MASVATNGLCKSFGSTVALAPTTLDIEDGEFVVIVGPSGCGKSTLLRLIAGLEDETSGRITIGPRDVTDAALRIRSRFARMRSLSMRTTRSRYAVPRLQPVGGPERQANVDGRVMERTMNPAPPENVAAAIDMLKRGQGR